MNSLSWLLYVADVCDKIPPTFAVTFILLLFSNIPLLILRGPNHLSSKFFKSSVCVVAFLTFLAIFTPSQKTVLLIAASEVGERVINSPTGDKLANTSLDLLQKMILTKIEDLDSNSNKH